jgi:peptidyl-prolyl cis-trans isomerase A (cyclophilin A)
MIGRMRRLLCLLALCLSASTAGAQHIVEVGNSAQVRIETTLGDILVELDAARAPLTVENFLQYVVEGFYDGTVFHRIAAGFIVQGGGYLPDLTAKPAARQVPNESGNGLSNLRGTIAMARGSDPHSANSQFYFNLVDNSQSLDPRPTRWGYAVFGKVIEGMEVVDAIGEVATGARGEFDRDVPIDTIEIKHIEFIRE